MNKTEVVALLVKNLKKAVPEFADGYLDTSKSYRDLGVNSMELVEVVTRTGKELGMAISFAALSRSPKKPLQLAIMTLSLLLRSFTPMDILL